MKTNVSKCIELRIKLETMLNTSTNKKDLKNYDNIFNQMNDLRGSFSEEQEDEFQDRLETEVYSR